MVPGLGRTFENSRGTCASKVVLVMSYPRRPKMPTLRSRLPLAASLLTLWCATAASPAAAPEPVLTLTIRCDLAAPSVGDEIPITFVIQNDGPAPYTYPDRTYDRSGRMEEYKLEAVDKDAAPVPDPRAKRAAGRGGGLAGQGILAPGQSLTRTVALNRWALLTKAGTYRVTGAYGAGSKGTVSAPIEITLRPRTDAEMAQYIQGLSAQLQAALEAREEPGGKQDQDALVAKLVYTCDRRIVPVLIHALYEGRQRNRSGNMGFWAAEAFSCFLPRDERNTAALVAAATERGMTDGMCGMLETCGCPREQIKKLIAISLFADHPAAWAEGALAAQHYGDDAFTARLVAIATDPQSSGRDQAIYALALNRTDESVEALKQLLQDQKARPFGGRSIGQETAQAIRTAYLYRGNAEGRPLRPDDFGPEFQHP